MRGLVFVDERLAARRLGLLPRRSLGLVVGGELLILGVGRRQGALGGFMRGLVFVDERLAARRLGLLPRRSLLLPRGSLGLVVGGELLILGVG